MTDGVSSTALLSTADGNAAMAFEADRWILRVPQSWVEADDPQFELARVRDLARILATAAAVDDVRVISEDQFDGDVLALAKSSAPGEPLVGSPQMRRYLPSALGIFVDPDGVTKMPLSYLHYDQNRIVDGKTVPTLDLTGRMRMLVWGPHITLPPGVWRATMSFQISEYGGGRPLRFEWGHMSAFSGQDFALEQDGHYEVELDFEWDGPALAEFRVILPRGAFSGMFTPVGIALQQITDRLQRS